MVRLEDRPDALREGPEVRDLVGGEVGEARDDAAGDDEDVAGNHGLEVHEADAQRRLAEHLRGWMRMGPKLYDDPSASRDMARTAAREGRDARG